MWGQSTGPVCDPWRHGRPGGAVVLLPDHHRPGVGTAAHDRDLVRPRRAHPLHAVGRGDRSDWVRNLLWDPEVTVRVGSRRAPELRGHARVVDPDSDEDELARALVTGKYQPTYGGDLSGWRREALPVAVDLEQASPDRAGADRDD
jgi:F420H(2)-dependent quinone reductase